MAEFLEDDVQQILETYFTNTGQAISRSKFFGRTLLEFEQNTIAPMRSLNYKLLKWVMMKLKKF
jgi:hypothetical protein